MIKWTTLFLLFATSASAQESSALPEGPPYPEGITPPTVTAAQGCHIRVMYMPPTQPPTVIGYTIAADGTAQDATVVQSSGDWQRDEAYRKCALTWTYHPAQKDGVPIAVHTTFSR